MTTASIANRLIELCREGKFPQAQKELYADNIASIETDGSQRAGLAVLLAKEQAFLDSLNKITSIEFSDPVIAGSYFSARLMMEIEIKNLGYKKIDELCVYRVLNDKIVSEQFFRD
jgi:hypothetical protein